MIELRAYSEKGTAQEYLGPYRILGHLGSGGMGVVYRCEHSQTGELAAVKTVRTSMGAMLASIRREIHALRRLRHPGIVRIVEEGVHKGIPWYAMELLEGNTLRSHLRQLKAQADTQTLQRPGVALEPAPPGARTATLVSMGTLEEGAPTGGGLHAGLRDSPEPAMELLKMMGQLCASLMYLHGHGLIHRDLKPENVFIRPDGSPVLVDLGISAQFSGAQGREELALEELGAGSVSYMAPEQILGELVDPRTDLYALGCMLYECVAGRPPFIGPSAASILEQHLHQRPVPPSRLVRWVPPALEHLILNLLEKRATDRVGYAGDVARPLRELGGAREEALPGPGARAYLYRPELSGREDVLTRLQAMLSGLVTEWRGSRVFIGGESGVGKTRLVLEFAREAARNKVRVVTGHTSVLGSTGAATSASAPLHPFRPLLQAIADRCQEHGAEETERLLGRWGRALWVYEPTLAELPGPGLAPEPPQEDPQAARALVLGALKQSLFAFARRQPLLLIIDDLQWADELSLNLLQELQAEDFSRHGVLLICTYRLDELSGELSQLVRGTGAVDITLGRLDARSARAMAAGMLALRELPSALSGFLQESSDGNPFFIAEYLRAAIDAGLLTRGASGEWRLEQPPGAASALASGLPLPRTLAALIEQRLAALDEQSRRVVEIASVLGREFAGEQLQGIAALDDRMGMDVLEILRVRQILEESERDRLRFVHDKVRELAYEAIPGGRRRELHHRAATFLAEHAGVLPEQAPALAHHFAQAGIHDKASHYYGRAGDYARAAYANGQARAFYREALVSAQAVLREGAAPQDWVEVCFSLRERLGDMLALTGQQVEARAVYQDALAHLPGGTPLQLSRLHRKLGKSWETHHQYEEALRHYRASVDALGAPPQAGGGEWWQEWIQVHIAQILLHYWSARVEEMTVLAEQVRPALELHATAQQRAQFFQMLARVNFRREQYMLSPQTVQYARAAWETLEPVGDLAEVAEARFFYAFTLLFHGSLSEAEAQMRRAVAELERVGDVAQRARGLTYLTVILRRSGRVAETQATAELSLSVSTEGQMADYIGAAKANLAWAAWRGGRMEEAERDARAALAQWQPLQLVYPLQWMARLPLAAICRERGELAEAARHAQAMLDASQQRLPEALAVQLGQAVEAWSTGDAERAQSQIDTVLQLCRSLGFA